MATGNFILNGSRKKVGSIVTYRRLGKQIVRAAAGSVSNPRTAAQAQQRALFAPGAKFYSPLATCLERSFEGKNKAQSTAAFLKRAITDCGRFGWFLAKGQGFFPLPFMLSKGTLPPVKYTFAEHTAALILDNTADMSEADLITIGGLSQVFMDLGYKKGDQITIIGVFSHSTGDDLGAEFWPTYTSFILHPNSTLEPNWRGCWFSFETDTGIILESSTNATLVAAGIIVSRFEHRRWKRSTQRLACNQYIMNFVNDATQMNDAVTSYMNPVNAAESNVYLNHSLAPADAGINVIALNDGTAVRLQSISYADGVALVRVLIGSSITEDVNVNFGHDYLLTSDTRGSLPTGYTPTSRYLDGNDSGVRSWLQSNGVAASVFTPSPLPNGVYCVWGLPNTNFAIALDGATITPLYQTKYNDTTAVWWSVNGGALHTSVGQRPFNMSYASNIITSLNNKQDYQYSIDNFVSEGVEDADLQYSSITFL